MADYCFRLMIVAKLTEIKSNFHSSDYSGADGVQLSTFLLTGSMYC